MIYESDAEERVRFKRWEVSLVLRVLKALAAAALALCFKRLSSGRESKKLMGDVPILGI